MNTPSSTPWRRDYGRERASGAILAILVALFVGGLAAHGVASSLQASAAKINAAVAAAEASR